MKYFKLFICFFSVLCLTSCINTETNNITDNELNVNQSKPSIEEPILENNVEINAENDSNEPVYVSPLAKEDFLTPFENYSWELTEKPEYVMLHFTSAVVNSRNNPYNLSSVRTIFENSSLSIHYIIDREGIIYCWLPETRAAWHAGKGALNDDDRLTNAMNKYSIGIEILAIGSKNDMAQYLTSSEYDALNESLIGYTDAQYLSLKNLVEDICIRNAIPFDSKHVIGHDMYNPLKNDPGELFEWDRIFAENN